ncbi:MAG: metal ABC transporter solute-binding protein, Zn/Mn family [Trueperaceae bacterium]
MPNFSIRRTSILILALLLALFSAAGTALAQDAAAKVVASVGMVGDVAAELAGACAQVDTLMGPGVDPHGYRATASDVRAVQNADLVLYVGLGLEARLGEVLARLASRTRVVAVGDEAVAVADRLTGEGGILDPHAWMDPNLWRPVAARIATALTEVVPAGCTDDLRDRAAAYDALLGDLDAWTAATLASVPESARVLVTAHDAFVYFGRAYGLEVVGLQGLSTVAEASLGDVRATADLIAERGVPAVFVESTINPRTIESVRVAVRDRGTDVALGGELFSDAFGSAGTPEGTYVGMIVHNAATVATALGGAPAPLPTALADWLARWPEGMAIVGR